MKAPRLRRRAPSSAGNSDETVAAPRVPEIPGFEAVEQLGRGGMGVVYRARQVGFNREVALKMILVGEHADDRQRERFRAEAEAVAALNHPHIVQVFAVGEHEGSPYFAMEYCPAGTLADLLNRQPQPPARAVELVEPVVRGVQAAHELKIVHRDIKPANVLMAGAKGSATVPKLTDFGLAKQVGASGMTRTGAILGTLLHSMPRRFSNR